MCLLFSLSPSMSTWNVMKCIIKLCMYIHTSIYNTSTSLCTKDERPFRNKSGFWAKIMLAMHKTLTATRLLPQKHHKSHHEVEPPYNWVTHYTSQYLDISLQLCWTFTTADTAHQSFCCCFLDWQHKKQWRCFSSLHLKIWLHLKTASYNQTSVVPAPFIVELFRFVQSWK